MTRYTEEEWRQIQEEVWNARVKAMQDRREREFQDDWIMAIGMDVLRDRGFGDEY